MHQPIDSSHTLQIDLDHMVASICRVSQKGQGHSVLVKLPPVFTKESSKHGESSSNLRAILRVIFEYENSPEGNKITLSDLPVRYNALGGKPALTSKDSRKVHNWMQQVNFAMRAGAILDALDRNIDDRSTARQVFDALYSTGNKKFITYSLGKQYELKPLRYADDDAKIRWISQEVEQVRQWNNKKSISFGAKPTMSEWELFGLKGQSKTAQAAIALQIDSLVKQAMIYDHLGRHDEADAIDHRLYRLYSNLENLDRVENTA